MASLKYPNDSATISLAQELLGQNQKKIGDTTLFENCRNQKI